MAESEKSKIKDLLFGTQNVLAIVPGLLLAIAVTVVAIFATNAIGKAFADTWSKNPLSPILLAIVIGLLVRNIVSVPKVCQPGITFGLKKLLRFGIILMGIRLSIFAILKISGLAVGMVVICIVAALVITMLLAKKIGVSDKLGTLIAAGTSICGVSAIVATSPTIGAEEEETAYAVATITIFGIVATIFYPYLAEKVLSLPVAQAGFFLGTSVNDTSQVTATAMIYDQLWGHRTESGLSGADIAITTKLVRNTFMILVIPFLGFWFARKNNQTGTKQTFRIAKYIPLFVLGYILMGVTRSLGDYAFGTDKGTAWHECWGFIKTSAGYIIAVAIAGIGLNTDIRKLAKLGYKPFACGLIAAVSVGAVSWLLVTQFSSYLSF